MHKIYLDVVVPFSGKYFRSVTVNVGSSESGAICLRRFLCTHMTQLKINGTVVFILRYMKVSCREVT
jgi:hypothetical protein